MHAAAGDQHDAAEGLGVGRGAEQRQLAAQAVATEPDGCVWKCLAHRLDQGGQVELDQMAITKVAAPASTDGATGHATPIGCADLNAVLDHLTAEPCVHARRGSKCREKYEYRCTRICGWIQRRVKPMVVGRCDGSRLYFCHG